MVYFVIICHTYPDYIFSQQLLRYAGYIINIVPHVLCCLCNQFVYDTSTILVLYLNTINIGFSSSYCLINGSSFRQ